MAYVMRRILATLPVMAVVSVIAFLLMHLAPVDPALLIAGDDASPEDLASLRASLGLDQPLWIQFGTWLRQLLAGDLGVSLYSQVPVTQLLYQRMEPTLSIAILTTAITVIVAVPLGTLAARYAGSWLDRVVVLFVVTALSAPVFLVGYLLIYVLSIQLGWFSAQGYAALSDGPVAWLRSILLPCINLAMVYIAVLTRMTRATVLQTLHEDYIRTARAKGLGEFTVLMHALRNAAVPIATTVGIGLTLLVGGVVVTESVFAIPGIGRLVIDSVQRHDYPVIQGVLLVTSAAYVFVNLMIDLSYRLFDPRIQA